MDTEYQEWLNNLKSGDSVAIRQGFGDDYGLYKVERITKTMVVLERGSRYSAKSGYSVGAGGGFSRIEPITDKVKDTIKYRNLKYQVHQITEAIQWACRNGNGSMEELQAVKDLLDNDAVNVIVEKHKAKVTR